MHIRYYTLPLSLVAALPLTALAVEDQPDGFIEGSRLNVLARNFYFNRDDRKGQSSPTGNGGNGSNGCAFTSGDRIIDGTSYSNQTFTLTLGSENATNATGNNVLIRIKLESGDSITALSIE